MRTAFVFFYYGDSTEITPLDMWQPSGINLSLLWQPSTFHFFKCAMSHFHLVWVYYIITSQTIMQMDHALFRLGVVRYTSISSYTSHITTLTLKNDKIVHEREAVMKTTGK